MTLCTLLLATLYRASTAPHIQLLMSHMLGRSVEDIWIWGRAPATCKADSVRRGVRQKSHKPHPPEGSHPNNFHMVFKQEGAMIYGGLWAAPNNTVASASECVTEGEGRWLLMLLSKCQSSSVLLFRLTV